MDWSGPAFAGDCEELNTKIATKSFELPHTPLLTVQRKIFIPTGKLEIDVVGLVGVTMVPPPVTNVHVPVDGAVAVLAAIVAFTPTMPVKQSDWSGPALAVCEAALKTFNVISSNTVLPHCPFWMVHLNT